MYEKEKKLYKNLTFLFSDNLRKSDLKKHNMFAFYAVLYYVW